jgi:FkbM family methyltransferase
MGGRSVNEERVRPVPAWIRLAAKLIRQLPTGRHRAMNWLCRPTASPFLMPMPAELGGYAFRCHLQNRIARELCFTGRYEPQETALVQALLRPGMTFVDVGANWGYYTLLAAHLVGVRGQVVSLEPDPRMFAILEHNARHNGLRQVTAFRVAAADQRGLLTLAGFDEPGANWGISRMFGNRSELGHCPAADEAEPRPTLPEAGRRFAVPAMRLDELFDYLRLTTIDLLKMDIEGAEGFALAGLANSLREHRVKRLLVELHPEQLLEHGQSEDEVFGQLRQFGYQIWIVDHSPRMTRHAASGPHLDPRLLLRPLDVYAGLHNWPSILCVAPG